MQTIKEAVEAMEDLTERLKSLNVHIDRQAYAPIENADIVKAHKRLRAALGNDAHYSVRLATDSYDGARFEAEWEVYVGSHQGSNDTFIEKSKTLEGVVNLAMARLAAENAPVPDDQIESVNNALCHVNL